MAHFDQSCDLSLKLLRQVVLARVLAVICELELLDSYVVLFVSCFEDISRRASSNLLLDSDVFQVDPEVLLALLELL